MPDSAFVSVPGNGVAVAKEAHPCLKIKMKKSPSSSRPKMRGGGEFLKRGNFGDRLVPVLIGAVILSVTGMGSVAFFTMRGAA